MTPVQLLLNFAKDLATNYDCQCDGDSDCHACKAEAVIREVLGDKAESLLKGPYYGSAPDIVESLKDMGRPTDHLTFGGSEVATPGTKVEGIYGWCLTCKSPCFIWSGTCRGCAGKAVPLADEVYAAWEADWIPERARVKELRAEVDRLRDALKPFAEEALRRSWIAEVSLTFLNIGGSALTNGDLRRAAEVLGLLQVIAKEKS